MVPNDPGKPIAVNVRIHPKPYSHPREDCVDNVRPQIRPHTYQVDVRTGTRRRMHDTYCQCWSGGFPRCLVGVRYVLRSRNLIANWLRLSNEWGIHGACLSFRSRVASRETGTLIINRSTSSVRTHNCHVNGRGRLFARMRVAVTMRTTGKNSRGNNISFLDIRGTNSPVLRMIRDRQQRRVAGQRRATSRSPARIILCGTVVRRGERRHLLVVIAGR
jgi:hypothetical protein